MLGKHKFHVRQRVRPSPEGIAALLFKRESDRSGIVKKVDEFNCPTVRWDRRRTDIGYHADFIMPDRRRKTGK